MSADEQQKVKLALEFVRVQLEIRSVDEVKEIIDNMIAAIDKGKEASE